MKIAATNTFFNDVKNHLGRCALQLFLLVSLLALSPLKTFAANPDEIDDTDEISITMNVQRIGSIELPALINGGALYLPIKDVFNFLKIKNAVTENNDSITGYFINPQAAFLIDKNNNRILYQNNEFLLKGDELIRTNMGIYMRCDYFGRVFGLECTFNFRSLSVVLSTKIELPAIIEMQQENLRKNIGRLKGERIADAVISQTFPLLNIGMLDWSVLGIQDTKGNKSTRFTLGLGGMVLGGETNVIVNQIAGQQFSSRQQFFRWRYVNNENSLVKQISAGRVFVQPIATLLDPVNGIQISNTPTTFRKSFGTYRLTGISEPGWMVELYVNNVLVNYLKADASGFYAFDVPLMYGNTAVKLRFFGPWGEEKVTEQNIAIPFNFLPVGQFEYNLTAGVVEDGKGTILTKANFSYGLGSRISINGGAEYLSSLEKPRVFPYVSASFRIGTGLLMSGEYTPGIRRKGFISYRTQNSMQLELNYVKFERQQKAVNFNNIEEKKFSFSMPIRSKKFNGFTKLSITQVAFPKYKVTTGDFLISGVVGKVSSNLTTFAVFNNSSNPLVFSNLSMNFRLPSRIRFTPGVQYEYQQGNFSIIKADFEKQIFNQGFINMSLQHNLITKDPVVNVGFRYNFSFAQTFASSVFSRNNALFSQSARGSVSFNDKSNHVQFSSQNQVGRANLLIVPFLDLNNNGIRDEGEPKAYGLNLNISGGKMVKNLKDTTISVLELEAFSKYFIQLDTRNFEHVSWRIKNMSLSVSTEANNFKLIEVPVTIAGEMEGVVYQENGNGKSGLGRIIVNIYDKRAKLVAKVLSEQDGYFNFLGLAPGKYTAKIDEQQLQKINMTSSPEIKFTIKQKMEGDYVNGLEFTLKQN